MPNYGMDGDGWNAESLRDRTSLESHTNQLPSRKVKCASVANLFSSLETMWG